MWLDRETIGEPPDYVSVLYDLRDISQPVFAIEAVVQSYNENSDRVRLEFVFQEQAKAVYIQDFGGWLDVESLLYGLNAVLADTGKEERFIMLYTGDQSG